MFNKILVPLDGSALAERAIDLVEKMAKGSVAEVLLLKVVPAPSRRYGFRKRRYGTPIRRSTPR